MSFVDRFLNASVYLQAIAALVWLVAVVLLERQRRQEGKRVAELEQLVLGHGQILGSVWINIEHLGKRIHKARVAGSSFPAEEHEKTDPGFQFPINSDRPSGAQQSVMPTAPWQCTACWRIYELSQFAHGKRCEHCGGQLEALEESESNASS
jgi:hypothetical protein